MAGAGEAPNRPDMEGKTVRGRNVRLRDAARDRRVTQSKRGSHAAFTIQPNDGQAITLHLSGRMRWALSRLAAAGASGCTPLFQPAPRWSGYIHELRKLGVEVETLTERHEGDFPGHHGRYVLRCQVREGGEA